MAVVGELYLGALDTGVWMQIAFLCVLQMNVLTCFAVIFVLDCWIVCNLFSSF